MAQENKTSDPLFYTDKKGDTNNKPSNTVSRGGYGASRGGASRGGYNSSRGGSDSRGRGGFNSSRGGSDSRRRGGFNSSRGGSDSRGRGGFNSYNNNNSNGDGSVVRGGYNNSRGSGSSRGGNDSRGRGGFNSSRGGNNDSRGGYNNSRGGGRPNFNDRNKDNNNNNIKKEEKEIKPKVEGGIEEDDKKKKVKKYLNQEIDLKEETKLNQPKVEKYYTKSFGTDRNVNKTATQAPTNEEAVKTRDFVAHPPNFTNHEDVRGYASTLFENSLNDYLKEFKKSAKKDDQMNEKMQHQGTTADRVAAITLLVQSAPMYRIRSLDILIDLLQKKSDRDIELSMVALKDLFLNTLLPDHKLNRIKDRMPIKENEAKDQLALWYFEDMLKYRYIMFVNRLEVIARENTPFMRIKVIDVIFELLSNKPELEETLMTVLVNKLGDLTPKVGARVCKNLRHLLFKHPGMRMIVIREIESVLNRRNVSSLTQLNCVRALSQIIIFDSDKVIVARLIEVYLGFLHSIAEKQEFSSASIPVLLVGLKSAIAVTKEPLTQFDDKIVTLFKIVHSSPLHTSILTLAMLYEMKKINPEIKNRFYNALYSLVNRTELVAQLDQTAMINLLYKAIKNDDDLARSKAFIKRVLQFATYQRTSFTASALLLVSTLFQLNQELHAMIEENREVEQPEEQEEKKKDQDKTYDPYNRSSQFAKADDSCLWELTAFANHYHPSVQVFATTILALEPIKFKGNPSITFTLPAFLEKFVVVNPTTKLYTPGQLVIKSSTIAQKYGESLPDEEFLNRYFKIEEIHRPHGEKTEKRKGWIVDDDELDAALYGADDHDVDVDLDGLDSDDDDDDLDAEYSYEDLADSDFDEDTAHFNSTLDKAIPRKPNKKSSTSTGSSKTLAELAQDPDLQDSDEDFDTDEDIIGQDEDDETDEDDDAETPDFGEDDQDDGQDDDDNDDDDDDFAEMPDFGEDDQDDDDDDDELDAALARYQGKGKGLKKGGKKSKVSDDFADADDYAQLLEDHTEELKPKKFQKGLPTRKPVTSKRKR